MPASLQIDWLPFLLVFCGVLLLLIGCSALATRTPTSSSTQYPLITLTVYDQQALTDYPLPTPPPITAPRHAAVPSPSSGPPGLIVEPPTCYDTPNRGLLCLGVVRSRLTTPVEQIRVRVGLSTAARGVQTIALEQRQIPAGGFAPYRALFRSVQDGHLAPYAELVSAEPAAAHSLLPVVQDERGVLTHSESGYGRYVVTAALYNPQQQPLTGLRAIVTLFDAEERVVGYRVQPLGQPLLPGERRSIRVEVVPQVTNARLSHALTIEGG